MSSSRLPFKNVVLTSICQISKSRHAAMDKSIHNGLELGYQQKGFLIVNDLLLSISFRNKPCLEGLNLSIRSSNFASWGLLCWASRASTCCWVLCWPSRSWASITEIYLGVSAAGTDGSAWLANWAFFLLLRRGIVINQEVCFQKAIVSHRRRQTTIAYFWEQEKWGFRCSV